MLPTAPLSAESTAAADQSPRTMPLLSFYRLLGLKLITDGADQVIFECLE